MFCGAKGKVEDTGTISLEVNNIFVYFLCFAECFHMSVIGFLNEIQFEITRAKTTKISVTGQVRLRNTL